MKLTLTAFRNMLREGLAALALCAAVALTVSLIENLRARADFYRENCILTEQGDTYIMDEEFGYCTVPKSEAGFAPEKRGADPQRIGIGLAIAVLLSLLLTGRRFSYLLSPKGSAFYRSLPVKDSRIFFSYFFASALWAMLLLALFSAVTGLTFAFSPYLALSFGTAMRLLAFSLLNFLYLAGLLTAALSERGTVSALPVFAALVLFPAVLLSGYALSVRQTDEAFYTLPLLNDTLLWWNRMPLRLFSVRAVPPEPVALLHYSFFAIGAILGAFAAYRRRKESHLLLYLLVAGAAVLFAAFEFSRNASFASRLIIPSLFALFLGLYAKFKGFRGAMPALAAALVTVGVFLAAVLTAPYYLL